VQDDIALPNSLRRAALPAGTKAAGSAWRQPLTKNVNDGWKACPVSNSRRRLNSVLITNVQESRSRSSKCTGREHR
jgi:hypothetical protein